MSAIFLDITPLLDFVVRRRAVSGVQRVEARLIAELARLPEAHRMWCADVPPRCKQIVAWRLNDVYEGESGSDLDPLLRLATGPGARACETWHDLRRQLRHRGIWGWCRAVGRASFLRSNTVSPMHRGGGYPTVPSIALDSFPPDSTVVLLGASWNTAHVAQVLRRSSPRPRAVHCVHDLIPLIHPQYFEQSLCRSFARHYDEVTTLCTDFVCMSQNTQADLERSLAARGRPRSSVLVRLAHEFHGYPRNAVRCQPSDRKLLALTGGPRPYVLCVGTVEVRKNGLALLDAWVRLRAMMADSVPLLVMCGRRGWKVDQLYTLLESDPWLSAHVVMVPSADDADLAHLYENALLTVYPSLYEGWGLPVGESAWFGKYCIASSASSIPEVCGDLFDYFDPEDHDTIARMVHRAVTDRTYLALRESRIREAPLRTWQHFAADFHAALSGRTPADQASA